MVTTTSTQTQSESPFEAPTTWPYSNDAPYGDCLASVADGNPSGLPMVAGVPATMVGFLVGIALGFHEYSLLLIGATSGAMVALPLSAILAVRLSVYEQVLIVGSKLRKEVIARDSIEEATYQSATTYHAGMPNGDQFTIKMTYGGGRQLTFERWYGYGKDLSQVETLVTELGAKQSK